ncbi:MAG: aminotransferase class IV family protein [Sulfurimonas sp.]
MKHSFLETIKAIDGEVKYLEYHQKRYESVLNSLGIKQVHNLKELLNPPKKGFYRCRVVYSIENVKVEYIPYKKRQIHQLKLLESNTIEYSRKYADRRELDALFLQKGEGDDILIIKNGFVSDTSIANLAFFNGEHWLTPKTPLLQGTTRARLLEEGKIFEKDIRVEDIYTYKKIALMNAMIDFDIIAEENIRKIIVR